MFGGSRSTSVGVVDTRPHVVIIGGGFAGLSAARELASARVRITLVDRANHHTFQPLLYQVATAGLAPSDITVPIRWRLRKQKNTTVLLADVRALDPVGQTVTLDDGTTLSWDFCVVATGARHAYFGHPEWEAHAPGLKSIEDALDIRQRFLLAFERAERSASAEERAACLTFVIVGGGPTGVELAGAIPDIARKALVREFRNIDTRDTRVILVEAGPRLLPAFPASLSAAATRDLRALGVDVRLGAPVTAVDARYVHIGAERIPTRTVLWAAGNVASPLGAMTGAPVDRAGRVQVALDCSVPGHPNVFVAGDLAIVARADGTPAPAVAPTANQTGRHAARMIRATLAGKTRAAFRYLHKGDLATIGRHKAVAVFATLRLSGYLTWFLWLFVHLMYLVGFRNRATVLLQWAYAYFTYQRGVRLITSECVAGGDAPAGTELPVASAPVLSAPSNPNGDSDLTIARSRELTRAPLGH
jgi:NADH dehydrogenase